MREGRGDIEDITRLQLLINDRFKGIDLQQIRVRTVLLHRHFIAHAPAAAAGTLNDKHIVLVEVRTHAAARYGERDHQVVNTPVRQRPEGMHQGGTLLVPVIHRLYQQRPVGFTQVIVALKRAVADVPFTILMTDQAAVDFALHRQPSQLVRREGIDKVGYATLQHYRALLPVTLNKIGPVEC